ncbi:MAG: type II secretion system protein [Planctomycetes bacterium]|nr:type II secretion system protein [Planctomycetota bacterium]
MPVRHLRHAFTLVELLVVVSILAIISAMVVGLYSSATDKAAATVSMATQKQLLNQMNSFMQLHDSALPDGFDSLLQASYAGTYTTLGTYTMAGEGTMNLNVGTTLTQFIAQPVAPTASTDAKNVNRGVDLDMYSGANRVLTVKQITSDDYRLLSGLGLTTLYDTNAANLSYGEPVSTARTIAVGGGICMVDPQGVAGQKLYKDFGVDLSDTATYPIKGSDDAGTAWDDTYELTDAGRLAALKKQMFFVLAVGLNSKAIGDRLAGLQEAPASSVVSQGYYNRFSLVLKKGGMSAGDRNAAIAGVLDPKGRGTSAARQAVNAIR